MSCELAKCAIVSMQLHRSATYWVHNDTPSGVLRPPKRFINFVACGNLDRHSRFCLSRFRLCHICISGSNHGHGTSAWRLVTVEIVTDFDCSDFDCPNFVGTRPKIFI